MSKIKFIIGIGILWFIAAAITYYTNLPTEEELRFFEIHGEREATGFHWPDNG